MKTKILVLGKDGQVGWELERALSAQGVVVACDRQTADLSNPDMLVKLIRDIKPAVIVNGAAYTAVDKAESEMDLSMQVNGTAPGIIAEEAKKLNALFIHYSTDYVFNGLSKTPYKENDPTQPLNAYGASKLSGERAIQAAGGKHLILRTTWVYGMRGKNFLLTMLKLAKEKDQLKIVMDQIGAPTWSRMIAQGTSQILERCLKDHRDDYSGIYHMTAAGQTSWCGFAETIFRLAAEKQAIRIPNVTGIPSSEYPLPAKRPAYSVLSNKKLQDTFGIYMASWQEALSHCLSSTG